MFFCRDLFSSYHILDILDQTKLELKSKCGIKLWKLWTFTPRHKYLVLLRESEEYGIEKEKTKTHRHKHKHTQEECNGTRSRVGRIMGGVTLNSSVDYVTIKGAGVGGVEFSESSTVIQTPCHISSKRKKKSSVTCPCVAVVTCTLWPTKCCNSPQRWFFDQKPMVETFIFLTCAGKLEAIKERKTNPTNLDLKISSLCLFFLIVFSWNYMW